MRRYGGQRHQYELRSLVTFSLLNFVIGVCFLLKSVYSWPYYNHSSTTESSEDYVVVEDYAKEYREALANAKRFNFKGCKEPCDKKSYRIAFVGTSVMYYNDLPYVVGKLFETAGFNYEEKSVIRSGQSLVKIWGFNHDARGVLTKLCPFMLALGPATFLNMMKDGPFDYVVLQDNTQAAARDATRQETANLLRDFYVPAIYSANATPIIYQTTAYRDGSGVPDLGDHNQFFGMVAEGYEYYQQQMDLGFRHEFNKVRPTSSGAAPNDHRLITTKIAPIGKAFADLRESNPDLFRKLFTDNKHPSTYGTLLGAYIIFWTITEGQIPPPDVTPTEDWWQSWRRIRQIPQFPDTSPTDEETQLLWWTAKRVYLEQQRRRSLRGENG